MVRTDPPALEKPYKNTKGHSPASLLDLDTAIGTQHRICLRMEAPESSRYK